MVSIEDALTACRELQVFAKANRPKKPPKHPAGFIVLWTVARSDKTFQAIVYLCDTEAEGGFGEQAGMLNRTLFEDMATAHWATRFPERAVKRIIEQDRYVALENGRLLKRHKMTRPGMTFLTMTKQEEERLKNHYARGGWTRKSVPQIVKNIAPMWEDANERRLLMQMHDIGHRVNNTLMHHSGRSLSRNVTRVPGGTDSMLGGARAMSPRRLVWRSGPMSKRCPSSSQRRRTSNLPPSMRSTVTSTRRSDRLLSQRTAMFRTRSSQPVEAERADASTPLSESVES